MVRAELESIEAAGTAARNLMSACTLERERSLSAGAAADIAVRDVRTQLQSLAAESARIEGDCAAAATRAAALEAAHDEAVARLHALTGIADEHVDLSAQRTLLEASLADARATIEAVEAAQAGVAAEAGAVREQIAALAAQRDAAVTRLGLLDVNAERAGLAREQMLRELNALGERIDALEGQLGDVRAAVATADSVVAAARRSREAAGDEAAQIEAAERGAQREDRDATAAGEAHRRRLAEIDAELGMLQANFAQHPAGDAEQRDVVERYADAGDDVLDEVPRLREELARLANVNLNAETDRDELAEREAFLRAQLDDLSRARETLLATIREIETACQTVFNETFEAVRTQFELMFARLFPGGEAKMWQTHPDSLSETGIEIAVAPPGKKMTALPALSGGERAMTAAALIFALIRVKPSPFYLLDEVDAALDDANVERLSAMIRDVASAAQILVVTHNKKTMELASRMYGVTMAEAGVSSIISAALDAQPAALHPTIDDVREPALVS